MDNKYIPHKDRTMLLIVFLLKVRKRETDRHLPHPHSTKKKMRLQRPGLSPGEKAFCPGSMKNCLRVTGDHKLSTRK